MNDESGKLVYCVLGSAFSWVGAVWAFFASYSGAFAALAAIVASAFTVRAAIASRRLSEAQRKQIEDE